MRAAPGPRLVRTLGTWTPFSAQVNFSRPKGRTQPRLGGPNALYDTYQQLGCERGSRLPPHAAPGPCNGLLTADSRLHTVYGRVIAGRGRDGDRGGNGRLWRAGRVVGVLGSSYSAQLHARRPLVRFYGPCGYTASRRRVNQGLQWPWPATHCLDAPECRPYQKISFRRFSRAMGGSAAPRTRPLPTCGARGCG